MSLNHAGPAAGEGEQRAEELERWYKELRPYLLAIAYRMLGSPGEAEDAVQDVFLSLQQSDAAAGVRHARAYLARMVVNRCLNVLNSAVKRRETYVGPWLPEPLLIDRSAPLPDEAAELNEEVSYAFLVLLDKLAPLERAVFVLRETFGCDYVEIAAITDKSEANCRQIFSRAKRRLEGEPAEPRADRTEPAERTERERSLVRRFVAAFRGGRTEELARLLAEDAILLTDGGGKTRAAINPIYGRTRSLALLAAMAGRTLKDARFEEVRIAGGIGVAAWEGERLAAFLCFDWGGEEEPLRRVYTIYNPDKLAPLRERLSQS